nr:hypothetical protein [Anaerolineae bacterium]
MQIVNQSFPVDILTSYYRVHGELVTRGDPTMYLNNQEMSLFTIRQATLMPLRPGMRVGAVMMDEILMPKAEPQLIILGKFDPQVRLLPKSENLVCFTDSFVLNCTFHMSPDTRVEDMFFMQAGPFYAATNIKVSSMFSQGVDVNTFSEFGYLRGDAIRAFYTQAADQAVKAA